MTGRLHGAITSHPHWAAFDAEEAKAHRLAEASREHSRASEGARREWEAATSRWEADREEAALEGREPDESIPYPGEFVEPRAMLGRRRPVEVAHRKLAEVEEMRRAWARRMAPELAPALGGADARALAGLAGHLDGMRSALADAALARESLGWVASCGGDAPLAGDLFEVRNLLAALGDALARARPASEGPSSRAALPMNLDGLSIE